MVSTYHLNAHRQRFLAQDTLPSIDGHNSLLSILRCDRGDDYFLQILILEHLLVILVDHNAKPFKVFTRPYPLFGIWGIYLLLPILLMTPVLGN